MSTPAEGVVRQMYEFWRLYDSEGVKRALGPDVVFDWRRRLIDPAVAEGRDAVMAMIEEMRSAWQETTMDIEDLVTDGERVLAMVHVRGRGLGSGATADARVAHLWTIRDGLAHRMVYYGDREEARAALEVHA